MRGLRMRPAAVLLVLAVCLLPAGTLDAAEVAFTEGSWVQVKGSFDSDVFEASEIEALDERSASVKGVLDGFDTLTGELLFDGWRLPTDAQTRFLDEEGEPLDPAGLGGPVRVKVSLKLDGERIARVKRVRLLPGEPLGRLRLEGSVTAIRRTEREVVFRLLGVEVRAGSKTGWQGIRRPRVAVDDEDLRPGRGIRLGRAGRLSGEVRLDYIDERNADLADVVDDDLSTGRVRARLEWLFPSTRRVSGMLQVKAEEEREIVDPADAFADEGEGRLALGRAYLHLRGFAGPRLSLMIGRSRFDDERDWLFNRDLDAVRLFYDTPRMRLELSVGAERIDPVPRHRDANHGLASLTFYPGREHAISVYAFERDDGWLTPGGAPRDFSPRYVGLRANGGGSHYEYWLDAAQVGGSNRGRTLDGHGYDAGLTLIGPGPWEPSLTLGYAFGSGDEDPFDDVDGNFRQSGLHLNNGKFNGVSSFRYYGEVMRPELSNLRITTIGVGVRPRRRASIDLIYHEYRLDVPASELVDAAFEDRRLNLIDLEIGRELDLVLGYEEWRHVELELDVGIFEPAEAFLGPKDEALALRLKVKFVF